MPVAAPFSTRVLPASEATAEALRLLRDGELVALPTETVYGLAADAGNGEALAAVFEAKGRPRFNPLIVHVADQAMAEQVGAFDPLSRRLAERFWPGPLTIVLPLRPGAPVHPLALAGLATVALRRPQGFASSLAGQLGRPLAAPSANPSGRLSPTTAEAVRAGLEGRVRLVVDGGPCAVGVESTIVKVDGARLFLLRPGGVAAEEIASVAGVRVERPAAGGKLEAPGMMISHYAPDAPIRLDAHDIRAGEALLAFGPERAAGGGPAATSLNLSPTANLREAASNLFGFLRRLDEARPCAIAVEPIPAAGLGEAINDRLRRAAAPRG